LKINPTITSREIKEMKRMIVFTIIAAFSFCLFSCASKHPQIIKTYNPQCSKFVVEQPEIAKAYSNRGIIKLIADYDYKGAIEDFTIAICYKPSDAELYVGRGLAYLKNSNNEAAKIDFDKAASLDPRLREALESLRKSSQTRIQV
jgi:Tfp pilus assembly protein PilF